MVTIPEIETDRLLLTGWRLEHFEPLADYYGDPATSAPYGGPIDRVDAWKRLTAHAGHWLIRGFGHWAIEEKRRREFVGFAGVWFPEGMPEPELSWGLRQLFHGRGYATEAVAAARRFAFEKLGFETLASFIDADNDRSRRVAERIGARFEGQVEIHDWQPIRYRHRKEAH